MIRDQLAELIRLAADASGVDPVPATVHLEQPARREHGDWSSNTALASAKKVGKPPRELANAIVEWINANRPQYVERAEVAGPGFVNFFLTNQWLTDVLSTVLDQGPDHYAKLEIGAGTKVNVEFVSANPTGPVHAGHARNAFYGDALGRLLRRVGYEVSTEFYINDRGIQMNRYAESLAARAKGEDVGEDGYHGQYIIDWASEMPTDADPLQWGYAKALQDQRDVLGAAGVTFETWFSENALVESGAIETTLDDLKALGATEERDSALWLKTTEFGDDKDRVLIKSDGEYTYFTPDIAYHRNKFERGFDLLINVWGADHHGYVPRMKAAVQALGHEPDQLDVRITQLVKLLRNGEEVKLSKRAGQVIEMAEIIDEVGADAARITYLLQSIDTPQTIDLAAVAEESMDNPVYYIQMAHTRVCSIARVAAERGIATKPLNEVELSLLDHPREAEAMRALFDLPDLLALAAKERSPHRVTTWLRETAGAVHGWYHDCPVLSPATSEDVRQARLWLAEGLRVGLRVGLDVLGVSAPESM